MLCTDLDRTLLPNGKHAESVHARPILWHLLNAQKLAVAYVSGRDLRRVLEAIDDYALKIPEFIVCDVGTCIYVPISGEWVKDEQWDNIVASDWNGASSEDIKAMLKPFDFLQDQELDRQSSYKQSYYFPEAANELMVRESIDAVLSANSVKAALVFSHDPQKGVGLLDVLPESATKAKAVAFLQTVSGLSSQELMFAGDSGNDVTAICADNPAVLVANADNATRDSVRVRTTPGLNAGGVCFAKGGLPVIGYDSLNGNYAAGIIEGLMHFRPHWLGYLRDSHWLAQAMTSVQT